VWNSADASIAAGQFFTLFLVEPSASLGQLERFPYEVNPETLCLVCHTDRSTEAAMECERVSHLVARCPSRGHG